MYQQRTSAERTARETASPQTLTGRAATVVRLAGELASLAAAGDLEAAHAVHETIGRLLAPVLQSSDDAAGAVVVDLEAERGAC